MFAFISDPAEAVISVSVSAAASKKLRSCEELLVPAPAPSAISVCQGGDCCPCDGDSPRPRTAGAGAMPVSGAALLVSAGPLPPDPAAAAAVPAGGRAAPPAGNFGRGDKTSSSVRLRRRREDVSQPGRKHSRHSGDFSHFQSRHQHQHQEPAHWEPGHHQHQHHQLARQPPAAAGPAPPAVVVRMREAAAVSEVKLRPSLASSRAVSASVANMVVADPAHCGPHQHHQQQRQQQQQFRKSGDFSLQADSYGVVEAAAEVRRRPHARSQSQQPVKSAPGPGAAAPAAYLQVTPARPGQQQLRVRREESCVTKRCSGEFEFKRINRRSGADFQQLSAVLAQELDKAEEQSFVERMVSRELYGDSGSEGSEESGIFSTGSSHESPRKESRKPGLGRRAITQVNLRQEKKNSYNHALAKSQENLVKVCKVLFLRPALITSPHRGFCASTVNYIGTRSCHY